MRGGSVRKGYLSQASGISKGEGFYSLKYTKGWGNLSFGSLKGPKGLTDEFYGFIKSRKGFTFVIDSYLNHSAFTAVRDAKF